MLISQLYFKKEQIDYSFTIALKSGKLVLTNHCHGSTDVSLYGPDDLYTGLYFMTDIDDSRGNIKPNSGKGRLAKFYESYIPGKDPGVFSD